MSENKFEMKNYKEPLTMGILNVTPDSFSDGGQFNSMETALAHAEEMINAGADIIDIGGESTRPGYTPVTAEDEIARVVPIMRAIKEQFDIPVSLDTYKSETAKAGLEAGCDIINDIWCLKWSGNAIPMADAVGNAGASVVISHNRENATYNDLINDIKCDLEESIALAQKAGVKDSDIIIDPGVGFAKDYEQNVAVLNNIESFVDMGYPVLLGVSRKSVIRIAIERDEVSRLMSAEPFEKLGGSKDLDEITHAINEDAISRGVKIVRTHKVWIR